MEGSRCLNAELLREQIKPLKTTMAIAARRSTGGAAS
jgi:hypothetical protein